MDITLLMEEFLVVDGGDVFLNKLEVFGSRKPSCPNGGTGGG
jgi:hypothetical protein